MKKAARRRLLRSRAPGEGRPDLLGALLSTVGMAATVDAITARPAHAVLAGGFVAALLLRRADRRA